MYKKISIILTLVIVLIFAGVLIIKPNQIESPLPNPLKNEVKKAVPSETLIEYTDPAGFSLNYPDNLSIEKNDLEDDSLYADIELISKDVNGSLNLRISDSKYKSLDAWIKSNTTITTTPKEVKLGSLPAQEIKLNDRLLLGALDQGILFTIEIPLIDEQFWMKVYEQVLKEFSFVTPESSNLGSSGDSSSDVSFEGEEVVE